MSRVRAFALAVLPIAAVLGGFVFVLHADGPAPPIRRAIPKEPYLADRCTWDCHNHGCKHAPVLPAVLASDRGLFGVTLRALSVAGRALSRDAGSGYRAANLVVFCAAWPAITYGLWLVALRQRRALRTLEVEEVEKDRAR